MRRTKTTSSRTLAPLLRNAPAQRSLAPRNHREILNGGRASLALCGLLCAALVLAGALTLLAQKSKPESANLRSLKGIVFDPQGNPVEQAVVQIKNSRTLEVTSFITKPDGEYHFANLRQDTEYQVRADHDGLTSDWRRLSIFDDRKVAEMNLKLTRKQAAPKP